MITLPADDPASIMRAADVLKRGGLVAYPTESFYAIGADALNRAAVERVFVAKGRKPEKPIPVIVGAREDIPLYTRALSPIALKAVEQLAPGPVTMIFYASDRVPDILTGGSGKVGVRVPDHPVASALAAVFGGAVTATSANISGAPGVSDPEEVARLFGDALDLLLDGGVTPGPPPSTLLDLTVEPPRVLRGGRVKKFMIERKLGVSLAPFGRSDLA